MCWGGRCGGGGGREGVTHSTPTWHNSVPPARHGLPTCPVLGMQQGLTTCPVLGMRQGLILEVSVTNMDVPRLQSMVDVGAAIATNQVEGRREEGRL